ncbi:T9SS type A sorting domain-containing protein [Roseivirga sp.]|uniref:T9SS type A sorting domain-containing protein n=1 Tax=Roseivirga sp. TaxID=1964215 RepID=UPI003B5222B3
MRLGGDVIISKLCKLRHRCTVLFVLFFLLTLNVQGQTDILFYFGQSNYDVSTAVHNGSAQEKAVGTEEAAPEGVLFRTDGLKMYVIGASGKTIVEYTLTTPFDVSTANYDGVGEELDVSPYETNPRAMAFSTSGDKLFVLGDDDSISEFTLASSFDISAATYQGASEEFSVSSQETNPRGLTFSNDGLKMFITGVTNKSVIEYTLGTAFDVSTAGSPVSFSISAQENIPQDLAFNNDGTLLFVIGSADRRIIQYSLSTPYDISTASYDGASEEFLVASQELTPTGLTFNGDGSQLYVVGSFDDRIVEYTIDRGNYAEAGANDGSIDNTNVLFIDLSGTETFQDTDADNILDVGSEVTVNNIPSGLTAVMTLSESDTRVTLTLTGNADSHNATDDVSDITFVFDNTAFTGNDASSVRNSGSGGAYSTGVGISFDNVGSLTYSGNLNYQENAANDGSLDNSNPLIIDLVGDTFQDSDTDDVLDVGSEVTINNIPAGLTPVMTLSNGDTRVTLTLTGSATNHLTSDDVENITFVFDNTAFSSGDASQVDNSGSSGAYAPNVGIDYLYTEVLYIGPNSFDVGDGISTSTFSVGSQEVTPTGMQFSSDGLKMFVIGSDGDAIVEYALTSAFDITTASYAGADQELNVAANESNPQAIKFNNDGTKLYILGNSSDTVFEYDLSKAYDISTASLSTSLSVASQENDPRDLTFNSDGSKLFVIGANGDAIVEYSLSVSFDVSTATYLGSGEELYIGGEDNTPLGFTFNYDGTKLYVIGTGSQRVSEYSLSSAYDVSTATFDGSSEQLLSSDNSPQAVVFNNQGTIAYILGNTGNSVRSYSIDIGDFLESSTSEGQIDNTNFLTFYLQGDTFTGTAGITVNNIPAGLTGSLTQLNTTTIKLELTGTANSSLDSDDVASLSFVFSDATFTNSNAADITNSGDGGAYSPGVGVDFADSGPGGVITNLVYWVKADNGTTGSPTVTAWLDQSSGPVNATSTGDPALTSAAINFNPYITFDGNDYFTLADATGLPSGNTTRTYILAGQSSVTNTSAGQNGFFAHGTAAAAEEVGITFNSNSELLTFDFNGVKRGDNSAPSSVFQLGSGTLTTANSSSLAVSINGASGTSALISGTDTDLNTGTTTGIIGADLSGSNAFNGNIAEIAIYSSALSASDLQKVDSYLAVKYGVTLSSDNDTDNTSFEAPNGSGVNEGDYVASDGTVIWDASLYQTHHNNIAAIGRDDGSLLNQKQSKSINTDAIVTIGLDDDSDGLETDNSSNPNSFSTNISYLVWGHDNADLNSGTAGESDFNPAQVNARNNREWRVSEVGDVGTVLVQFDISGLLGPDNTIGTNDDSQVVLLVDADGDFTTGATVVNQSFVVADDNLVNFLVDFSDGNYFTIGSSESSALPITLVSFEANEQHGNVELSWVTSSEIDNSHFRLERSKNGIDFDALTTVEGMVNSNERTDYAYLDIDPHKGVNFYRLVDVDLRGNESVSEVISIELDETNVLGFNAYPNPVKQGDNLILNVDPSLVLGPIEVLNVNGNRYYPKVVAGNSSIQISTTELPVGLYMFRLTTHDGILSFRVVVR